MIVKWQGDRALVDRDSAALLYGVSPRTVRRYCRTITYDQDTGQALVDALAADSDLADVIPRGQAKRAREALLAALQRRATP